MCLLVLLFLILNKNMLKINKSTWNIIWVTWEPFSHCVSLLCNLCQWTEETKHADASWFTSVVVIHEDESTASVLHDHIYEHVIISMTKNWDASRWIDWLTVTQNLKLKRSNALILQVQFPHHKYYCVCKDWSNNTDDVIGFPGPHRICTHRFSTNKDDACKTQNVQTQKNENYFLSLLILCVCFTCLFSTNVAKYVILISILKHFIFFIPVK